ncbi:MAG: polysaccharide biosynthesis tyrosine autokinase [Anaerolineales bacterium]|jgi:capsular exopolysaccharide synthesis family protein|nr:polysaccharide biosynthesis tyrosine autokinase [Anaerolineales bacterium]
MEIKEYARIAWHWAWLLAVGLILGGLAAYFYANSQTRVYQTSIRVQIVSALRTNSSVDYSSYMEQQQLAQTYVQTLRSRPVTDAVAERIGGRVTPGQIRAQIVQNTQLIDIFVTDTDPQRPALIANTLVDVFIERNNLQQAERFNESERSLEAQIQQIDTQIDALEAAAVAVNSEQSQDAIKKALTEIDRLQGEIVAAQTSLDELRSPARLPDSLFTPTPSFELKTQINEKELKLKQLETTYNLYQQIYTNLVVLGEGRGLGATNLEQEQMQSTLALYRQIRANLLASYENVRLARLSSTSNIVAIEPALMPGGPISPQPLQSGLLGAAVGLMLAGGIVFLIEYLDDTIKSAGQASALLGLPVIGYIAELEHDRDKAYVSENPRSPVAEAFRTLRTNLEFAGVDKPIKSILVVSAHPGEGKSTVAINLAVTIAQGGKKTLLIDADLRRPRVHHYLGLSNRLGLSNLFRDSLTIADVAKDWKDSHLKIITSGGVPPNPADLLASDRMAAILAAAHEQVEMIVVDAPPFLVADASILASRVDGVLFVVYPGRTPSDAALTTLEQMRRAGANVLGIVLNRIPRNRPNYYGGYRYYSGYYKGEYGYYDSAVGRNAKKGFGFPWPGRRSPKEQPELIENETGE